MLNVSLRTLQTTLDLALPDQTSFDVIRFIHADPDIVDEPHKTIPIRCERIHGFIKAKLPCDYLCEGTPDYVLSELHRYHFLQSKKEYPGQLLIHGGTLTHDGQHTIIVGEKGAGKSTLLLHLGLHGLDVMADEHVFVSGDMAIPRCRTLRIKEGTLSHVPEEFRAELEACPHTRDWHGSRIFSVSPRLLHGRWKLARHRIRNIVFLEANHGGLSQLRPLARDRALEILMAGNILLPEDGRLKALSELHTLLATVRLWQMRVGQLDATPSLIYEIL